jgi:hypothetical protein
MAAMGSRSDQQQTAKRVLTVRVSDDGYRHIVDRAQRGDVDVSHMIRRMLVYAATHMPMNWLPPHTQPAETTRPRR